MLAGCGADKVPPAPPLSEQDLNWALASLDGQDRAYGLRTLVVEPPKAMLHELVETGLIKRRAELSACIPKDKGKTVAVATVGPGGTASLAVLEDESKAHVRADPSIAECLQRVLGPRPFKGVEKDHFGGRDYGVVAFRPILLDLYAK
jgi:hypothetical protein